MTLALTAPFGWPAGTGVTLLFTAGRPLNTEAVERVLLNYSCYPPAISKILSCLSASGRYDCRLQATWFKNWHEQVKSDLAELGILLDLQPGEEIGAWCRPDQNTL